MKFWAVRIGSLAVAVLFALFISQWAGKQDNFTQRIVVLASLYVTLSVSLNLINGITGQFSIGHAAFYQIGAYTGGYLTMALFAGIPFFGTSFGMPVWLLIAMIGGALVAALAGFIVGLPSLRLKGDYLAIVTLGFGEIIRIIVQNVEKIGSVNIGGAYGMNISPKIAFIWMDWLLAFLCIAICRNLLKTAKGLTFLSVREDEVAAQAMGVNVTRTKVIAFIIGSAFAGAAGAALALNDKFISPTQFTMDQSFVILTMVVVGGTGSITGSAIAGAILFYLPERLRDMPAVTGNSLVGAIVGIVVAVYCIKRISEHFHGSVLPRIGLYVGSLVGGYLAFWIVKLATHGFAPLANATYEADRLRMVIFAGSLVIVMLVRPQGILAHHEFSWSFVMRLFRRPAPTKEVAA